MNNKPLKIAFFDTKPYDRRSFEQANEAFDFDITYFEAAFGRIHAVRVPDYSPYAVAEHAAALIISLHCPLTPETSHMINDTTIPTLKDGVMLINTGRGGLIDTKALVEGLKSGKIGAAGLDVYEEESDYFFEDRSVEMIADDVLARLLTFPNVLVTSHQAFFTHEALHNIAHTTLNNLKEYFEQGLLTHEVCYQCQGVCPRDKTEGEPCFEIQGDNHQE